MKKRYFALFLLAAVLFYLFLAPRPLSSELIWVPQWNISIEQNYESPAAGEELFPFIMENPAGGKTLGYVSSSGKLVYSESVFYNAAVHPRAFVNFSAAGGRLVVQNPQGHVQHLIDTDGYPVLKGDWFLVLSRDRKGVSRWSWSGEKLWDYHFSSLITVMDIKAQGLLLGFLNGDTVLMDEDGGIVFLEPHRDETVYGAALASGEPVFGIITGLAPQKLKIYSYTDASVSLLWEAVLDETYRSPRELFFALDDHLLCVENRTGAVIWDARGRELKTLEFSVPLGEAFLPSGGDIAVFWTWGKDRREIRYTDPQGRREGRIPLAPDAGLVHYDGKKLLISQKGQIFGLDRELF